MKDTQAMMDAMESASKEAITDMLDETIMNLRSSAMKEAARSEDAARALDKCGEIIDLCQEAIKAKYGTITRDEFILYALMTGLEGAKILRERFNPTILEAKDVN